MMIEKQQETQRIYMEQHLRPAQGDRFQPTGFADLGAAVYDLPGGGRKLLVESVQSMANRFEAALIGPDDDLRAEFKGLSYLKASLTGAANSIVTSLTEPHRINSPWFISDKTFQANFVEKCGYRKGSPLDWRQIGAAIFYYDINSLLHGCFLANLASGRIKTPRALSAFIEADNPREALSGGVKINPIDPAGKIRSKDFDKDVYGNVPFARMEYTAETITAYFSLDIGLLRGYGLPQEAFDLLVALGLYKIRWFLKAGVRLRTACDLLPVGGLRVTAPEGYKIPEGKALLDTIQEKISLCGAKGLFAVPSVTELQVETVQKTKEEPAREEPDENSEDDT